MSLTADLSNTHFGSEDYTYKVKRFWRESIINKIIIVACGLVIVYLIYWIIMKLLGKEPFRGLGSMKDFHSRTNMLYGPSSLDQDLEKAGLFDVSRGNNINLGWNGNPEYAGVDRSGVDQKIS